MEDNEFDFDFKTSDDNNIVSQDNNIRIMDDETGDKLLQQQFIKWISRHL